MSWGTELWDKYSELTHHTQNGIDFLENSVGGFIKERGKVEAEYAKSLRSLVKKYAPKEGNNRQQGEEELTHIKAYKQVQECWQCCSFATSAQRLAERLLFEGEGAANDCADDSRLKIPPATRNTTVSWYCFISKA